MDKFDKQQHINNLDNCIASSAYLLDCLRFLKGVIELPTCNECVKLNYCEYCPKPGERVRYNCPHFVGGDE